MTDETTYIGSEPMAPDGYLQPIRYRIVCACDVCGEQFDWITDKPTSRNKPCPNPICIEMRREANVAKAHRNFAKIVQEQRGPATIGDKLIVKAVDKTAEIVMEDNHMTDLRDNIRTGDILAPALPAHLQRQADGYFDGSGLKSAVPGAGVGNQMSRRMQMLAKRALAGSYSSIAVRPDAVHGSVGRAPDSAILRYAGREILRDKGEPNAGRDIGGGSS